ncbi:MAG: hypothetical protein KJ630_23830 [Proteobacteria bacterium]|nr:hypothetical protein [Pseudomonadota bacterium]
MSINYTETHIPCKRKNRTIIVYFGIFIQYTEIMRDKARYISIVSGAMTQTTVEHKEGCTCSQGYTRHRRRERTPKKFRGERYNVPIWQIRCLKCKAVFTVLPSFIARYQRFDIDCLSKLLEINLVMTSSYRHTLKILEYARGEQQTWNPGSILHIINWLGDLLPLPCILLRLGLTPPQSVIEDEKFVRENGERTYIAFISQQEIIWWIEYLANTDELHLEDSFKRYLAEVREVYPDYNIEGATYDGWKAAKTAFEAVNINIVLQECHLHGKARMSRALPAIKRDNPALTEEQLEKIKECHDQVIEAKSLASYSQRLRQFREAFGHITEVAKRCISLKNKLPMFLAYLFFPLLKLAKVSTLLDQLIKFFDRKFLIMQTFRESSSANKTVHAFAIVRNFWKYMPGAKRVGKSPVEIAGADLQRIPWLEVVNLATTSRMTPKVHVTNMHDT